MGKFEVYNASAGAGKTYTLVKNYLSICLASENTMKFREVLAITFTNKAANEMKERIVAQLRQMGTFTTSDKKEDKEYNMLFQLAKELGLSPEKVSFRARDILTTILHNYSAFSVSTIDKFTNRLIRSFAQDLKLNSNYEVELDSGEMLSEAIDRMLADLEEDSATSRVLLEFINTKLDEGKSPRPEHSLHEMGRNLFDEGALPFLKRLKGFDSAKVMEAGNALRKESKEMEATVKSHASQLLELIHAQGIEKMDFSGGYVYGYITNLYDGVVDKWPPNKTVLKILDGAPFYAKAKAKDLAPKFDPIDDELRRGLALAVETILQIYPRYHLIGKVLKDIYSLATLAEIETNLELVKEETNRLPIGEFNKLISEKLDQEPTAYLFEKLGDRYHYFFVDEFQDTSVLQWKNLLPLVGNAMASNGSVMIVGDGKQSIYRWRGGDVSQFVNLSNDTDTSNKIQIGEEVRELYSREKVTLGSNFRSRREVVEFNNDFFTTTAKILEGENFQQLYSEASQKVERQQGGYVYLNRIRYDKDTYEEEQGNECLRIIRSAVSRGYALSDITLITRRKQEGAILAEVLLSEGISVVSPDSLMIEQSSDVRAIVSYLKFLVRPDDFGVRWDFLNKLWNSGIVNGGFTEKHLFLDKLIHESAYRLHSFLEANLSGYKLAEMLELSLVDKVYDVASLLKLPIQGNPFLHTFMDQIVDYQNKKGDGETGFLRWWDEKGNSKSISLPEGNDAVNIMTVHKSKGLEFPITIVPFADWLATTEPGGSSTWMDIEDYNIEGLPVARVGLSDNDHALDEYKMLHQANRESVYLDNMNLAYVAFTRAVDELYIIGSIKRHGEGGRLTRYISEYFTEKGIEGDVVEFGEPMTLTDRDKPAVATGIKSYKGANWFQKVKISIDAPLNWIDGESSQTSYGKRVHSLMAQVSSQNDVERILQENLLKGAISKSEYDELYPVINGLVNDDVLSQYYKDELEVINEEEILIPGNLSARPDRVVISGAKTHIIDYKTGVVLPKHREQLNSYRHLLTQMGYPDGDNVLIYLGESPEVVKW